MYLCKCFLKMKSFFGDLRIDLRVQKVLDLIVKFGTTVINR